MTSLIGRTVDVTIYDYGCSGDWTACGGYQADIVSFLLDLEEDEDGMYRPALKASLANGRRALWSEARLLDKIPVAV